jgi:hypothetical protein
MNFIDATNNMLAGKYLIRQSSSGEYCAIFPMQNYIWKIFPDSDKPIINAIIYTPSQEDILATDWIVKN